MAGREGQEEQGRTEWSWCARKGWWDERSRAVLGAVERPLGSIMEARLGRVPNAKLTSNLCLMD